MSTSDGMLSGLAVIPCLNEALTLAYSVAVNGPSSMLMSIRTSGIASAASKTSGALPDRLRKWLNHVSNLYGRVAPAT